jgi:hypothetical protein
MPPSSLVPGFLATGPTAGQLPYPMMPLSAQRVVRTALRYAWNTVQSRAEEHGLRSATEPQITTVLQFALNELLDDDNEPVPGFSSNYFEAVERGAEMVNYSGLKLEKRPDLRFRMQGRIQLVHDRTNYGLIVECKLLDAAHPLRLYAANGVLRFVKGDYAWAMPHGMMLAYVRSGTPTQEDLITFLKNGSVEYSVVDAFNGSPQEDGEEFVRSVHERSWQYPSSASSPGPIELIHVWLHLI